MTNATLALAEARAKHDALLAAADEAFAAAQRKIARIPKYRSDERVVLLEAADAALASALKEARSWDPITVEFRVAHPDFHRTGHSVTSCHSSDTTVY
jgi:hypothetical protein